MKLGRQTSIWEEVRSVEEVTFAMVERAQESGDHLAQEIFLQAAAYFGIGLSNLLNILHPQKVILGGPLMSGNAVFFKHAIQVAKGKTYHIPAYDICFEQSRLSDDAVAIGAAAAVVRQMTL